MAKREVADERSEELEDMVARQLAGQGIADPRILEAFRSVPRHEFVSGSLQEFAYLGVPLPIGHDQTISQPFIVALTLEALRLDDDARVLEIGTGSGYSAAVLSRIAAEVYTIERVEALANEARERLSRLGFHNVHVLCGDGTLGWPVHAPYEGIAVAAAGPEVPPALLQQLSVGGRLVIPVGDKSSQVLTEIVRRSEHEYEQSSLSEVRFVPLIGEQGWPDAPRTAFRGLVRPSSTQAISTLIKEVASPIDSIESGAIGELLERAGAAQVVLLGESTHGTSEFYRMRARITQELIEHHDFDFVAVEADWPDAARIHQHVRGEVLPSQVAFTPFSRFPQWMWRNREVHAFVDWMREHNLQRVPERRVGFHGLDLYSLYTSIAVVLHYLEDVDPDTAELARARYGLLTPWQDDPAAYGRAVVTGGYSSCEETLVVMLKEMLAKRLEYVENDGARFFDAAQNARLITNAERYYRAMYYGSAASWNLRDSHMFDTLEALLSYYGPNARGIVWEHNSHVGNAAATEMSTRGELNVGQLCRARFKDAAYIVGFGTHSGTVAAASDWGGPMQRMQVRPSHPESYERVCHDAGIPAFLLHLREPRRQALRDELMASRLERAIGVVYRPETELLSHYFQAVLPHQFDEYIWFDETEAVEPLVVAAQPGPDLPETYPFGV